MSRICTKKNAETHTDSYLGTKIWVVWQEQYVNETSLKYLGEKKKKEWKYLQLYLRGTVKLTNYRICYSYKSLYTCEVL